MAPVEAPTAPLRTDSSRRQPDRPLGSARVLLVEDDSLFASLVEEMLRAGGLEVTTVRLLGDAIEVVRRGNADCALLDLRLPDARDLEGVEALREEAPELPIVVLSGLDDESVAVDAVQRGAQDYLVKGHVDSHILTRAIRYAIERKQTEQALSYLAHHDSLTGLPNRPLFLDRLEMALARTERHPCCLAVLFVDLDRFKEVNDALGHEAGDDLLREIARRLQAVLRPADTVARLGGDEFVVLAEEVGGQFGATRLASRVCDIVAQPVTVAGREVLVTASVGVALARSPLPAEDLISDADRAMYRAKQAGGGYEVYDELDEALRGMGGPDLAPATKLLALRRLETVGDLHHALERGELRVHYQPQVELASGRVTGVEALVRWQHPERGLVLPGEFIPLAEETGLIVPIGRWVLRTACHQAAAWNGMSPLDDELLVSVNLAPRELAEPGLVEEVAQVIQETELEPSSLCLEMTESTVMGHSKDMPEVLHALKSLGVSLRLDDFGTGYSSLAALDQYPVDGVKIDRSFVARLGDEDRRDVFAAVVAVAHALRLTAIAEGVEEAGQLAAAAGLGCDFAQGNLFARASAPDAIEPMLGIAA
jgi:diguanylate cyclase